MGNNKSNLYHRDLLVAQELAYEPSGFAYHNLIKEAESAEYGASTFEMNNRHISNVHTITAKLWASVRHAFF